MRVALALGAPLPSIQKSRLFEAGSSLRPVSYRRG